MSDKAHHESSHTASLVLRYAIHDIISAEVVSFLYILPSTTVLQRNKARIFLIVDLRDFFFRFRVVGGTKIKK